MKWLRRIVADVVRDEINRVLDGRRDADRSDARRLIDEMEDACEKFSRVVAREGMRRIRAAKRDSEAMSEEQPTQPQLMQALPDPRQIDLLPAADRKALLRQRVAPQLRRMHAGGGGEE